MSLYIGVMSGTSLDGIDVALVDIDNNKFEFIAAETYAFEKALHQDLHKLIESGNASFSQLGQTDVALGQAYSEAVKQLLASTQVNSQQIKAVGCHGQTIYHAPEVQYPFSLQIGNANVIAVETGITTISDFRQGDMALGGQGAPLVPAFHQSLFADEQSYRVIANIGGISNITLLPNKPLTPVSGFDTGPGNGLMDQWFQLHHDGLYDKDGEWANSGQVNQALLKALLADPYFKLAAPKSTGREHFNLSWLTGKLELFEQAISAADVQRTLLELTVISLTEAIQSYADESSEVYICGGGAYNPLLMSALKKAMSDKRVESTSALGLAPDFVEACAFAWLARQTMERRCGNLPAVTGAKAGTILGGVYYSSSDAS